MTVNQFSILCHEYGIHPDIALENEELREALKARDDKKVIEILTNEFWKATPWTPIFSPYATTSKF